MEYFHKAKSVRLRSRHGKFLAAEPDEETVKQKSSGSGAETRWIVELVQGKPNLIRLKSSSSWKYLCAREETLLMVGGWSGKKVVQGSARLKSDPAVEWEPIKEGAGVTNHVKLRSAWKGTFLKGNGQMFWRNSVTHDDSPNSTATQDWILWVVDVLEFDHGNEMGLQQMKDKSGQGQSQGGAGSVQSQQQRPPPPSFTGVMRVMDSIKRQNSNSDDSPSTPPRSKPPPAAGGGEGIIAPIKSKWAQKPLPPPPASQVMESIEKQNNSKYKETPKKTPTPTPTPTPPPPMYDDNDNDNDNDDDDDDDDDDDNDDVNDDDDDDDDDDGGGYKTETNTNTERRGSYSYYTPAAHQPQQSNQNHHQHQPSRFSQPAADDGLIYYYTPKQEEHIRPATTTRRNDYYSPKPADADIIMKNISYRNVLDDWQKIYDNHDFTDIHQLPVGVNNSSTSSSTHNKKNKINIIIIPFEVQKAKLTLKEIDHHLNFKEAYYQGQLKQIEKAISTLLSYQNNNNISTAKLKRYQVQILSLRTNHDAAFTTLDQYDTFSNKRSSMKAQIQEQANRARDLQASEQDRLNALALARDKRDDLLSQLRDLEQQIREAEIALKDNDITLQELCRSIQNNKDLYNSQIEKQQNNWLARKVEAHDMIKRVENDWDQIKLDLSLHMLVDDY